MKFGNFAFLFLIYKLSFYLVIGQAIDKEKSDCTKLYNFLNGDSKDYSNSCCNKSDVDCDDEGYILNFSISNTKIKIQDFPYFSKISQLYIVDCGLKEIPDSILKLTSIVLLDLQKNNIEIIPPAIKNLSNLFHLDLSNNNIKSLPNELFNLTGLITLHLNGNHIEAIPSAIQNLSGLFILNLGSNNINVLPNEMFIENSMLTSL